MDLRERRQTVSRRHPWEIARLSSLQAILAGIASLPSCRTVLDAGCGDAFVPAGLWDRGEGRRVDVVDTNLGEGMLADLARAYPLMHFHRGYDGLAPEGSYDVATVLDVLEHEEDDAALLGKVAGLLGRGGALVLTVPAFPSLFGGHDRFIGHRRRYGSRDLLSLIEGAGLSCDAWGYLFCLLLPLRLVDVLRERTSARGDRPRSGVGTWSRGPLLTGALAAVLAGGDSLAILLAGLGVRVPGLSLWARCTRRR